MGLVAGVAREPIATPIGGALMGYGARTGAARAVHDPLFARALHLRDGRGALLLVELDVCLLAPGHAESVRARLAAATGVARECILVGSIHTHSGPETGIAAWIGGAGMPPATRALCDAAVAAGARAHGAA
ncbi:MAG: hypothetical protein DCC71_23870, partial [Proteobacteria bacterium]